jgi:hypothetical protein
MSPNWITTGGWWLIALLFSASHIAFADSLKPFVLANGSAGDFQTAVGATRDALQQGGFDIVGEYSPYADAQVIAVTNSALKAAAAKSEFGGFGAAQRVSVTNTGSGVQVAYANPLYTAAVFRMGDGLESVASQLANALGNQETFGSKKGIAESDLRDYHYMIAMPYFDDVDDLATFASHADAVAHIEARLDAGVAGTKKIYKIEIPGKEETVFGVGISAGNGSDATVMESTDTEGLKHTAHLPYQILVVGNKAVSLAGKFRIATSFPDLSMGTFMKISNAPGAIRDTLAEVAGGK